MLRAISGYLGRHHVALLALFLALGGTSVAAANYINGQRIKPGSIPENRLAPAATASFTASEAAVYCRAARSRPRSYRDAPCRSRAEAVTDGFNVGGIAIGTDGNPVITFGGHPINLVRCNDRICAGGNESTPGDQRHLLRRRRQRGGGRRHQRRRPSDRQPAKRWMRELRHPEHRGVRRSLLRRLCRVGAHVRRRGHRPFNSIAIGTDGNPVVSYYDNLPQGDLKVLRCNDRICDGSGDTINVVASSGDVGQHTSIATGTNGNPVIAYYDVTNHDLKVARCNDKACAGSNETISTVESAGDVGEFASLAIGMDGNPVIAYYKRSTGDLRVAKCNDPACAGGNEKRSTVAATRRRRPVRLARARARRTPGGRLLRRHAAFPQDRPLQRAGVHRRQREGHDARQRGRRRPVRLAGDRPRWRAGRRLLRRDQQARSRSHARRSCPEMKEGPPRGEPSRSRAELGAT